MNTDQGGIIDLSSKTGFSGSVLEDSTYSGTASQAATAAEKAREKKLKDDPMAMVLGPLHVDCRRCGARIKLSTKSPYDPLHWRMHRTRCLKRLKTTEYKETTPLIDEANSSQRISKLVVLTANRATAEAPGGSPLNSEDEHEPRSTLTSGRSSMEPTVTSTVTRHMDPICKDYIRRYHGKEVEESPTSAEHWKDWSWTRLSLPPAFATKIFPKDI